MSQRGIRHLLVAARGGLVLGVLCEDDLHRAGERDTVASLVSPSPLVAATAPAKQTIALLRAAGACCASVVMGGQRAGIVTRGDIIRAGLEECAWPRCASCGDHHRVHQRLGADVWFCPECFGVGRVSELDALYVDLGGGD